MKAPKVTPLGKNVLIAPLEKETKTASGIFLPDTASEEKPHEGTVKAIGSSEEIQVKKGQSVIYNQYSGTEVKVGNKDYLIIKAEDILAVIE